MLKSSVSPVLFVTGQNTTDLVLVKVPQNQVLYFDLFTWTCEVHTNNPLVMALIISLLYILDDHSRSTWAYILVDKT